MAKKKKEKSNEGDTDTDAGSSPEIQLDEVVMNRSQISVDKSTHTIKNVNIYPQDSKKEPSITKYPCPDCDREFDSKRSWRQHFDAKHGEDEEDFDATTSEDPLIPENSEPQFPNCLKCGDAEDVGFFEDGLACHHCKHVINEYGECIDSSCRKCDPEEDNEEKDDADTSLVTLAIIQAANLAEIVIFLPWLSLAFGLLFAVVYVFLFDEIYNWLTSQMYEWTYWAGMTFPFFILFGLLFALGLFSKKDDWLDDGWEDKFDTDRLLLAIAIVLVGPFIVASASIVGMLYGIFWLVFAVYVLSLLIISKDEYFDSRMFLAGVVPTIIIVAIAQFFIVFEDAFKGFGISYAATLDNFFPTVIKYELVYFLMSIGLGFCLIFPVMIIFAETRSEEEHLIAHGIIFGILFFFTEFFVYPLSDNILVAIIFATILAFISLKGTKMIFDMD